MLVYCKTHGEYRQGYEGRAEFMECTRLRSKRNHERKRAHRLLQMANYDKANPRKR